MSEKIRGSNTYHLSCRKNKPFEKISLDEADNILRTHYPDEYSDLVEYHRELRVLTHKGEKRLIGHFNGLVWVTHHDVMNVPFYQARDPKHPKSALNALLLFAIGEVVDAGERHRAGEEVASALREHHVDHEAY